LLGSRDWNITFTCSAQGVTLLLSGQPYSIAQLEANHPGEHPLRQAVRELIAKKQGTVRAGQAPFRPILRFEVPPDGQRAYLLAYAVLDSLHLPVVRHNIKPNEPKLEDYYRQP
jgi:hypothetical protein